MKLKLEKIFFCTGARNHDILKILPAENIKFEFDERMASFKALGLSKVSTLPVGICTTSGTAVSECVSAMLEAYYSNLPLVLITGDRPKKLHGTGSPQTIDHESITRSARKSYFEVTLCEFQEMDLSELKYPAHINVLIDDTISHSEKTTFHESLIGFKNFLSSKKKPLFLFSHENKSMRSLIQKFQAKNLTYYAETLSGGRDLSVIKTEKKLIELFNANYFDSIVRIGQTPLSKIWRLLEKKPLPVFHFDERNLPGLSFGDVLPLTANELNSSEEFWSIIDQLNPYPIADETIWRLDELIANFPRGEVSLFKCIQDKLPEKAMVYLGNSLVIRFFELTHKKELHVFGNRGVNGIDGQLATAIGLAMGTTETIYCILGDVTTFYDLSSLREMPKNLKLIIMNNNGGRIFDLLNLDKRIVLEHTENFQNISQGFGLSYSQSLDDISHVQVLELFSDLKESEAFLKGWQK